MRRLLGALALLGLMAGCGGTEAGASSDGGAAFPSDHHSKAEVMNRLAAEGEFYKDPGTGIKVYRTGDAEGCEIAAVLTSPNMVATYVEAGDVVATDPDQEVGVKLGSIGGSVKACHAAVTSVLANLK